MLRSLGVRWCLFCWVAVLVLSACALNAAEPVKKVLYVGIDGTRFDAIEKANTPNLDGLIADGIYSPTCLILGERYRKNDTVSGPGWSSILTGVWADKHGVHDNKFAGTNYQEFPHFFARLKETRPAARTVSLVTWKPIHEKIVSAADVSRNYEGAEKGPKAYEFGDAKATDDAV